MRFAIEVCRVFDSRFERTLGSWESELACLRFATERRRRFQKCCRFFLRRIRYVRRYKWDLCVKSLMIELRNLLSLWRNLSGVFERLMIEKKPYISAVRRKCEVVSFYEIGFCRNRCRFGMRRVWCPMLGSIEDHVGLRNLHVGYVGFCYVM
jgi:hypothetical protein